MVDAWARAAGLDAEADLLDAQAADRYERAARWYSGGSRTFVDSLDTADQYRREAKVLRAEAAALRAAPQPPASNDPFQMMRAQIMKQMTTRTEHEDG